MTMLSFAAMEDGGEPGRNERSKLAEAFAGMGLLLAAHIIVFGCLGLIFTVLFPAVFAIGLVQWIYVIPGVIIAFRRKRPGIAQGLLIGAGITLLLNAACFGFVFMAFN